MTAENIPITDWIVAIIAVLGFLLGIFNVIFTILDKRIRISVKIEKKKKSFSPNIALIAINQGSRDAILERANIYFKKNLFSRSVKLNINIRDVYLSQTTDSAFSNFPYLLKSKVNCQVLIPYDHIAFELKRNGAKDVSKIFGKFIDAREKSYKSRSFKFIIKEAKNPSDPSTIPSWI